MKIQVECYAGYRGEEEPRAFTLGERRFKVLELVTLPQQLGVTGSE